MAKKSYAKYKQELGKTCNTGFMTTIIAMFVTPRISNMSLEWDDYLALFIIAVIFFISGRLLLSEDLPKELPGKWKRVKIKKDTTIHVEEQE